MTREEAFKELRAIGVTNINEKQQPTFHRGAWRFVLTDGRTAIVSSDQVQFEGVETNPRLSQAEQLRGDPAPDVPAQ